MERHRPFLWGRGGVSPEGVWGFEGEGKCSGRCETGGKYQKFEGEYLFATRRIARVESEEAGKTA